MNPVQGRAYLMRVAKRRPDLFNEADGLLRDLEAFHNIRGNAIGWPDEIEAEAYVEWKLEEIDRRIRELVAQSSGPESKGPDRADGQR